MIGAWNVVGVTNQHGSVENEGNGLLKVFGIRQKTEEKTSAQDNHRERKGRKAAAGLFGVRGAARGKIS